MGIEYYLIKPEKKDKLSSEVSDNLLKEATTPLPQDNVYENWSD